MRNNYNMELLDVLDEQGNKIGVEERKIVHEKGLWHIHVGVWIMNQNGELLLQQRSGAKKVNPYKWTRTGGHVDSGEIPIDGIQREVEEEIGVKISKDDFEPMGIEKIEKVNSNQNIINRNYVYSYFAFVKYKLEDYKIQEEEVCNLKYMSIEEIEEAMESQDENYTFLFWETEKFKKTISFLKSKRKSLLNN